MSGYKDIGIRKFEFLAKTQFLYQDQIIKKIELLWLNK